MGDSNNLVSEIAGEVVHVAGNVGTAVVGELKKVGKTATGQITGKTTQPAPLSPLSQTKVIKGGSETLMGQIGQFGRTASGQISGQMPDLMNADIAKMAKSDELFSETARAEVRAKIKRIYEEYAAKRAREEQQRQLLEQQQEQEMNKLEVSKLAKKQQEEVNPAIAKTRAEIKNYGAE